MSTYGFNYNNEDRHIAYSFKIQEDSPPVDVYDNFVSFLNAVYGWDVREHLNENITS
jgi:hypothetical protein